MKTIAYILIIYFTMFYIVIVCSLMPMIQMYLKKIELD
jgi:hypothetical protein